MLGQSFFSFLICFWSHCALLRSSLLRSAVLILRILSFSSFQAFNLLDRPLSPSSMKIFTRSGGGMLLVSFPIILRDIIILFLVSACSSLFLCCSSLVDRSPCFFSLAWSPLILCRFSAGVIPVTRVSNGKDGWELGRLDINQEQKVTPTPSCAVANSHVWYPCFLIEWMNISSNWIQTISTFWIHFWIKFCQEKKIELTFELNFVEKWKLN